MFLDCCGSRDKGLEKKVEEAFKPDLFGCFVVFSNSLEKLRF